MTKKIVAIVLFAVVLLSFALLFFACSGSDNATYYEVKGGSLDESSWIKIGGGTWEDDSGESGTYEIKGDTITFSQDGVELMSATLKDGVLTVSIMGVPVGAYYTKDAFAKYAGKATVQSSASDTPAVGDDPGTGIISEEVDDNAKVKSITGGTVEGMAISYEVGENIEFVDLSGMLTVSKNSSWQLYEDITGQKLIPTKYAANLHIGNNVFYVVVNSSDDKVNRTYTLNIWKNYYVPVYYTVLDELYATEQALTHTYLSDYVAPSTIPGYTFEGWNCAGTYVTGDPLTFAASLTANTYTVTLDPNGGTLPSEQATKTVTFDAAFTLPTATRTGYTFGGWIVRLDVDTTAQVADERGASLGEWRYSGNKTLTAKWTPKKYSVKASVNNASAGSVSGGGTYDCDSYVTLTAATDSAGYTFLGWYDGEQKVCDTLTYRLKVPAENVEYQARWCKVTISRSDASAGTVTSLSGKYVVGDTVTITAATNNGYTWLGWYDGETKISEGDSLTYTFNMPSENKTYVARWIKVKLSKNKNEAGTISSLDEKYKPGDEVSITASTNSGFTWLGWYDGETKVSEGDSLTYTFNMPAENKTLVAMWIKVVLNQNNALAGTISSLDETYVAGEAVSVTASVNEKFVFQGWYDGETKLSDGASLTYDFNMPTEDKTITAIFMRCNHAPNENCVCTICGAVAHSLDENCFCSICGKTVHGVKEGEYCRHDQYIYFGSYPQSEVTDSDITSALNAAAGTLPTDVNSQAWTSYDYYLQSGNELDYMWYIDLSYNNEMYRGVYFTSYRPSELGDVNSGSLQKVNGYILSVVYWFKYEPIKWRILSEENEEALILCESIIDSQEYNHSWEKIRRSAVDNYDESYYLGNGMMVEETVYSWNYKYSFIRKWLNETFYRTAFTDLEKGVIVSSTVENSMQDYVSLLRNGIRNESYGFVNDYVADTARKRRGSDYAKSQGLAENDYYTSSKWWLGGQYGWQTHMAACTGYSGELVNTGERCDYTTVGVVPSMRIKL